MTLTGQVHSTEHNSMVEASVNIEDMLKMSSSKIDRLPKETLIQGLKNVIATVKQPKQDDISTMLQKFQQENREHFDKLNQRLDAIADKVKEDIRDEYNPQLVEIRKDHTDLKTAVERQQTYLEQIDMAQRANKIVIVGLPEDTPLEYEDIKADTDLHKCNVLLALMNCEDIEIQDVCRLGKINQDTVRPVKLTLSRTSDRVKCLENAEKLKTLPRPMKDIRVKKDTHPAVRGEWARLHAVLRAEREKSLNKGCILSLDYKNRQVLRDGIAIDTFRNPFL